MKNFIVKELLNANFKVGDKLPSVRELIKHFKTSSATVQAALTQLEALGKVQKIRGKGVFWGALTINKLKPIVHKTVIENLSDAFDNDFAHGFFKPTESLPLSKELTARYKVSQGSLRKFLDTKVALGILKKERRKYFFATKNVTKNVAMGELIFVTHCNNYGGFFPESERELDFFRLIYKNAGKHNYKLTLFGINDSTGELIDRNGRICSLKEHPNAVCAILSTLLVQHFMPLLNFFYSVKFPVAVWWEHPINAVPKKFLGKRYWGFFNSGFGSTPGSEMGAYLLAHNICEVNYFSPYHASSWSIDRLKGLLKSGVIVHEFTDNEFASPWDFKQLARKRVNKSEVEFTARSLEKEKLKLLAKKAISTQSASKINYPWVCVNDEVASLFTEIFDKNELREFKIKPTFIAFDNSMESYMLRFSSYDFNTESLVEQMFYYLENPDVFNKNKIHHIIGNVAEK